MNEITYNHQQVLAKFLLDKTKLVGLLCIYILAFIAFVIEKGVATSIWISLIPLVMGVNYIFLKDFSICVSHLRLSKSLLIFVLIVVSINTVLLLANVTFVAYSFVWIVPFVILVILTIFSKLNSH